MIEKRVATPEIIVNVLRMFPLETQRDLLFGRQIFNIPQTIMMPGENGGVMLHLNTEENMQKACDFRYGHILERNTGIGQVFYFISKPNRLQIFDIITRIYEIPEPEYSTILKNLWTATEFPHQHPIPKLVGLFQRAQRQFLMDENEYKILSDLPHTVTVYRGLPDKKAKVRGLSWTTDFEKAKWFASRFNGKDQKVMKAEIAKKYIFFYNDDRSEHECVVNPRGLKQVSVV
jgi:hypothetical protein